MVLGLCGKVLICNDVRGNGFLHPQVFVNSAFLCHDNRLLFYLHDHLAQVEIIALSGLQVIGPTGCFTVKED